MNHTLKTALNTLTRIVFFSWIVLITIVSAQITALQFLPGTWWIKPCAVSVGSNPHSSQPWVTLERNIYATREVSRVAVFSEAGHPEIQPCVSTGTTIEDHGSRVVLRPLRQMVPLCNFHQLATEQQTTQWQLTVYWTVHLEYGIDKTVSATSTPFRLSIDGGTKL